MKIIPLTEAKLNTEYKVMEVRDDIKFKRRLLEFGFVNTSVKVLQTSSLRGVYLIQLRGYVLALRRQQAESILLISSE